MDAGQYPAIDRDAAKSTKALFAVVSDYRFYAPAVLRVTMSDVATHLQRLYDVPPDR